MAANNYALKLTKTSSDRVDFSGGALGASIKDLATFTLEAWIKPGSNSTSSNGKFYLERQGSGSFANRFPRLAGGAWNERETSFSHQGTISTISTVTFSDSSANFSNTGLAVQRGAQVLTTGNKLGIVASITNATTLVVEAWIDAATFATVAAPTVGTAYTITGVRSARGKLRFEFARLDGTTDTNYTYILPEAWDDYWHHVAFTVNVGDKDYEIYYDGGLVQSGKIVGGGLDGSSNPLKVSNTAPQGIYLGCGYDGTTFTYWDGKIDNVRLWSSVRSGTAIQDDRYDHVEDPSAETSLIEEWRINTGSGSTLTGVKNVSWTGTIKRAGVANSTLWTIDRAFMGDGDMDTTPPSAPTASAPTGVTADGFTVTWSTSTDNVYVQYYELQLATDSAFNNLVNYDDDGTDRGLTTTYTFTQLTPISNYYWRIRALDAAANASSWATYNSNEVVVTDAAGDLTAPNAPVANAASSITYAAFTANWTVATDPGVGASGIAGYRLDVAYDEDFELLVAGWSNLDVSNVVTYSVSTGIEPATTYYYRVRSVDNDDNESENSNTVTLTTSDPPDTTPPDVVVLQPATSIEFDSFTANWNVGVDNIAVVSYELDVSTDPTFTTKLTDYDGLNVGNVTSYGVAGLDQQTTYYYQVRAKDAAGNSSANTDEYETVSTVPQSIADGGLLSLVFSPTADTYVNQASAGTNYGTSTSLSVDGTGSNVKRAYLSFDLTEVVGTIVNANLQLNVSNATAGLVQVKKVTAGSWDETTLTYTSDTLTLASSSPTPVDFNPSATGLIEVDVSSLLSGAGTYSLAIVTTSTDLLIFDSREGTVVPTLTLEVDQTTAIQLQTATGSASNVDYTNLLKNPSAEIGGASFGGSTGIVALVGAALTQSTAQVYEGTYSCQVVTAASANSGVKFESGTGLAIAGTGQTVSGYAWVRGNATMALSARLIITYTDATTTTGTTVAISTKTVFNRVDVTAVATNGKTVDKVQIEVYNTAASALTYWVDAAVVTVSTQPYKFYWDGDLADSDWDGTTNASTSTRNGATITAEATYVGDGNDDSTVAVAFRRRGTTDWISDTALTGTFNRTTKRVTTTVGPAYIGNKIRNPSFEGSTTGWSALLSGTTLALDTADPVEGSQACLVTSDGTLALQGIRTDIFDSPAVQNDTAAFSISAKSISGAATLQLVLHEWSAVGVVVQTQTANITLTTTEMARYSNVFTVLHASCAYVTVGVRNASATAASFLVDAAQLEKSLTVNPYVDGDMDDGYWEGVSNASLTYRVLQHSVDYEVQFTFADADSVIGTNPITLTVTTLVAADDHLTVVSLDLAPTNNTILATLAYTGDDNASATAACEWKRADYSHWSMTRVSWDRVNHTITSTIGNLNPGTEYNVRFTLTDSDDTVYGANPITSTDATTISEINRPSRERITFGGFVLSGITQQQFWVSEHDALGHPNRRTQIEELPRVHGGVELSDYWGIRSVSMKGGVSATSRVELADNVAALRRALAPRQQRLVIDSLESTGRYFMATCTKLEISEVAGETIRHVEWNATFECADPFRYDSAETIERDIILTDDDTVSIANGGDVYCEPRITVQTTSASETSFTLTNTTTGERLRPSTTITSTDRVVIDTASLSVVKNGVEIDYEGGFIHLVPGNNVIKAVVATGSITLEVRRRYRYI